MPWLHLKVPVTACSPSFVGKQMSEQQEITETDVKGGDTSSAKVFHFFEKQFVAFLKQYSCGK